MKLKLISPAEQDPQLRHSKRELKAFWFPRLSLVAVAALTSPEVEVSIIDENVETIDFNERVDLVGISAMTFSAPRAYEIADRFRARGVKVVLGGIHPSTLPHEAIQHADAVVIGEAEALWPSLIEDFRRGRMKRFYRSAQPTPLDGLPVPRRDLLNAKAYKTINSVQTTRGCPFNCDFCSVTEFFGRIYRRRPVAEVIREVEGLEGKFVIFIDDNIVGNRQYALKLFKALKPLKKRWGSQATINMAKDEQLLRAAADCGCSSLFVGIESLSQESLQSVGKSINRVDEFEGAIETFHDYGIGVNAAFIFGFDHDDEGIFGETVDFCLRNDVDVATFHILTPLPGTQLYRRLEAEGRIIERDWSKYNGSHVVFQPKLMSPHVLEEGYYWAYHTLYSVGSILRRLGHRPYGQIFGRISLNRGYRRLVLRAPEGAITPLAGLLNRLRETVPSIEREGLIPVGWAAAKREVGHAIETVGQFLKIQARKKEGIQGLIFDLEGILDRATVKALLEKVQCALREGQRTVVINFKGVRYISPKALNVLHLQRKSAMEKYRERIVLLNLSSRAKEIIGRLSPFRTVDCEMDLLQSVAAVPE